MYITTDLTDGGEYVNEMCVLLRRCFSHILCPVPSKPLMGLMPPTQAHTNLFMLSVNSVLKACGLSYFTGSHVKDNQLEPHEYTQMIY